MLHKSRFTVWPRRGGGIFCHRNMTIERDGEKFLTARGKIPPWLRMAGESLKIPLRPYDF